MAGDWIKMRVDLYRDPKVCAMADDLMRDDGDLARYVSQMTQRDMSVTRNVMRNVTVGALLSVWGVMRTRGKRDADDLVCRGVLPAVLDDIADLPGFGDAMLAVGWVEESAEGLVFPRFFEEHNADPAESARAKNAERQRRFREKKQAEDAGKSNVTDNVTVTHREEKRREEISEEDKSSSEGAKPKRGVKRCPESFELTDDLREWAVEHAPDVDVDLATAKFRDHTFATARSDWPATWRNWLRTEQERKRPGKTAAVESFAERKERRARERYEEAIGRKSERVIEGEVVDVTPALPFGGEA